jgi:hypothetical protein
MTDLGVAHRPKITTMGWMFRARTRRIRPNELIYQVARPHGTGRPSCVDYW